MKQGLIIYFLLYSTIIFAQSNFAKYVDPFIGTGGHGHTYPGATVPHGMVQLSPDTRLEGWDGCSGYHYSDDFIYGFSHTHLSGTGVPDYCDILIMPMSGVPSPKNKIYGSKFSHNNEKASAGFYSVKLDDDNIMVELTATERVGFHRYTFASQQEKNIILDLTHRDKVLESSIKIIGNNKIIGLRRSEGWARNQYVFFAIEFSQPFTNKGIWINDTLQKNLEEISSLNLKAFFQFDKKNTEPVMVKVAISQVSEKGALKNLETEIADWNFEKIKSEAEQKWNRELNKIEVSSNDISKLKIFYTALYHTMIVPCIANDVDGNYRGRDNAIHTNKSNTYYSVFSLWDTYRAAHPLYTIIDQQKTGDYINTFLTQYKQGGRLPVWELSSNETDCMIGYHAVSVIADAAVKGIHNFDKELALTAMMGSATGNRYGLPAYIAHAYLEAGDENESVSKTLEYAYDDWCIAQFAKLIGKKNEYTYYTKRAQYYKNLYDVKTGFMRPKINGNWMSPFDAREVNNNFTEANSWQYSFYVPQDITGFIKLSGSKQKLENKLDSLFTVSSKTTGRQQSDITGLIGQYAHGNEPSHHIAYLYNFVGKAYRTQQRVHQILNTMYHDAPDGLEGNEDCGQMSAWYVLSALGFYPVTPGTTDYIIGTPIFKQAVINLENGKRFIINAGNVSDKNFYIDRAALNGKPYTKSYLSHFDIMKGGEINFSMSDKPSSFGKINYPVTSIIDNQLVLNPVINGGDVSFSGKKFIKIYSNQPAVKIYYSLNGEMPHKLYTKPFQISSSQNIKAFAKNKNNETSKITTARFHYRTNNFKITYLSRYQQEYAAAGGNALVDELRGDTNWRKGNWQGFRSDLTAIIDLGVSRHFTTVVAGFLQDTEAWIIMPKEFSVEVSMDGIHFTEVYKGNNFLPVEDTRVQIKNLEAKFADRYAKFIRIKAVQYGKLPQWHLGAGGDSHIFIDEIIVK